MKDKVWMHVGLGINMLQRQELRTVATLEAVLQERLSGAMSQA